MNDWTLYLLYNTASNITYIGVTTDIDRRIRQHNGEIAGGGKMTRGRRAGGEWRVGATVDGLVVGNVHSLESKMKKARVSQRKADKDKSRFEKKLDIFINEFGEDRVNVWNYDDEDDVVEEDVEGNAEM